jgi:hypothetical protein
VAAATAVALICYVLYYRLDEAACRWIGMAPLVADSCVTVLFLVLMAAP